MPLSQVGALRKAGANPAGYRLRGGFRTLVVAGEDQLDRPGGKTESELLDLQPATFSQRGIRKLNDPRGVEVGFTVSYEQQGHGLVVYATWIPIG